MSKAQLKKLIRTMSAEDLAELLLQVYDARKDAKEFIDFYINPDIDKKLEECVACINKELSRRSKRKPAPRISEIKKALKKFESYQPEEPMLTNLRFSLLQGMVRLIKNELTPVSFRNGASTYLSQTLLYLHKTGNIEKYLPRIVEIINGFPDRFYEDREFKIRMQQALADFYQSNPLA